MANPNLSRVADPSKRIMSPRTALEPGGGVPAGECLNNWMPAELVECALCFVIAQNAIFRFSKFSTATPNGVSIIATMAGTGVPGRWLSISAIALEKDCRAIDYSGLVCTPSGTDVFTAFTGVAADIVGSAGLSFDADKAIVAEADMTVRLRYSVSYESEDNANWVFAVMLNGAAGTAHARCSDHDNIAVLVEADGYSVASGTTIVTLVENDTLELMALVTLGPLESSNIELKYGTLAVQSLV